VTGQTSKLTTSQSTRVKSEQRPPAPPVKRSQENDELIVKAGSPREGDKESTAEKKVTSSSDATLYCFEDNTCLSLKW